MLRRLSLASLRAPCVASGECFTRRVREFRPPTQHGGAGGGILKVPTLLEHHCGLDVFADYCPHPPGSDSPSCAVAAKEERPASGHKGDAEGEDCAYCAPKLIATIGPSSNNVDTLKELINVGMSIARLNFSHGTHDYHLATMRSIREASHAMRRPVAIALDTKGAEIRTGTFLPHVVSDGDDDGRVGVTLETGSTVFVTVDESLKNKGTEKLLYLDYPPLLRQAERGHCILIADGTVELTVAGGGGGVNNNNHDGKCRRAMKDFFPSGTAAADSEKGDDNSLEVLECTVTNGGYLSGHNNVHLPGMDVDLPVLSSRDQEDIVFGLEHGIDVIFASFVRNGDQVREIRALVQQHLSQLRPPATTCTDNASGRLTAHTTREVPIISKIENHRGLRNIDAVIEASDGVMVARGDLGVELPAERVFLAQKMMIAKCNAAAKPVICATQMLESMKTSPRPTRAEASDVANAVIDGADAVMLSAESASGQYPVEALRTLRRIACQGHQYIRHAKRFQEMLSSNLAAGTSGAPGGAGSSTVGGASEGQQQLLAIHDSVGSSAVLTAFELDASMIITTTISTRSVRLLSKYHPPCPIVAVCHSYHAYMKLQLVSGVIPVYLPVLNARVARSSSSSAAQADGCDAAGGTTAAGNGRYGVTTDDLSVGEWTERFEEWIDLCISAVQQGLLTVDGLSPAYVGPGQRVVVTCTDDWKGLRGLCSVRQM